MNKDKKRWLLLATLGLILIGMGLCLAIDAAFFKERGADTIHWVAYGTGALIVFNSGISVFGQAVIERIKLERRIDS
jgi:hypothetical protein